MLYDNYIGTTSTLSYFGIEKKGSRVKAGFELCRFAGAVGRGLGIYHSWDLELCRLTGWHKTSPPPRTKCGNKDPGMLHPKSPKPEALVWVSGVTVSPFRAFFLGIGGLAGCALSRPGRGQ